MGKIINVDESVSGQATVTCKDVTDMEYMFVNLPNLASIDLSKFDVSNVTNMVGMFMFCSNLASINLYSFDISNVIGMTAMFYSCESLTALDLSSFDTSNVRYMGDMFNSCHNLTTIKGIIDMKSCDVEESYGYNGMFFDCPKLSGVKIKNPPYGFDGAGLSSSQYTIVS